MIPRWIFRLMVEERGRTSGVTRTKNLEEINGNKTSLELTHPDYTDSQKLKEYKNQYE